MNLVYGILGMIGGLCCAAGEILSDMKGKDNQKLGAYGIMNSNWEKMGMWRFKASILMVSIGVPLYFLGLTSLANQLVTDHPLFGLFFWVISMVGSVGVFFIHVMICLMPITYKRMLHKQDIGAIERVMNAMYEAIRLPYLVMYVLLSGVTSLMIVLSIFNGYISLSPFFILGTPLSLMLIGAILQKLKPEWFYDLPRIVMLSLGLGMIGCMAVLNLLS